MPLLTLATLTGGCGGKVAPAPPPSLRRLSRLIDLSARQRDQLCAAQPRPADSDGGVVMCPGGGSSPVVNDPAVCRMTLDGLNPSCGATVAQWDDCGQAMAEHPCDAQVALDTDSCRATAGCDPSSCRDQCASVCQSPDAGGATQCLAGCFPAVNGLSRPCAACVAGAGAGGCGAMTFPSPDSDDCRTACGSGAVD